MPKLKSYLLLFLIFAVIIPLRAQEEHNTTVICTKVWSEHENSYELLCDGVIYNVENELDAVGSVEWIIDFVVAFTLTLVAGLASGLTLGLLSLDETNLQITIDSGGEDASYANKLLPLIHKHHQLLCTLLLTNAIAMEALPLFLDKMVPTIFAIIISVTLILLFGEIVPQATFSRYGLKMGAKLYYVVKFLMIVMFPIAWPLGKLLDVVLGQEHGTFFRRAELRALVQLHEGELSKEEIAMMKSILEMVKKQAKDILTPMKDVFMLQSSDPMNNETLLRVVECGRSRIPVYKGTKDRVIGILLVKDLMRSLIDNPCILTPSASLRNSAAHVTTSNGDATASSSSSSSADKSPKLNGAEEHPLQQIPAPSSPELSKPIELFADVQGPENTIGRLALQPPAFASEDLNLFDLLEQLRCGKSHLAVILDTKNNGEPLGILTLEDIIEEIIQQEIFDESDLRRLSVAGLSPSIFSSGLFSRHDSAILSDSSDGINMDKVSLLNGRNDHRSTKQ